MNKKRGNSTFESGYSLKSENRAGADSQLSGGHPRKFPRKRQNLSSSLYDDGDGDDDDLVQAVKSLRKGQFSGADSELSGGYPREYPRKRQNMPSILYDDDDYNDFVRPVKSLRKGQFSGAAGADSELSGGHPRKYPRKRQNLSSIFYDDFVRPIKSLRNGQFSGVAEKKRNIAAAGVHKKEARENVSFSLDKNFPNKKRKSEEFELKVKEAAMLDKEESNFKADVSSAANVASLESIEVPDPQFHKFVVDGDMLASLCQANQTWALYDTADGMPRFYAIVKKVLTPGFKLKVSWLEADPDDQGEIDWCEKELPVACGKFRLGDSAEITDHLMFSHQMHTTIGSLTGSVLVYPRKGETWAIYQNWDIGWSSEPEKHVSYKYEFVEVLSDFVEGDGIGVSYLGKVKGFVSLFQRTEQHGFQVPPDELYRFSHRIPSFKMTGHEGYGVPSGSFELDPASLPSSILIRDVGDLEIDNRRKNTKPSDLSGEFVERLVL
ncbi:hypothetical protein ABKV19_007036 [Rosa sericea]